MIGISPAYYISKYGSAFTLKNIEQSLDWLSSNGFTNIQLEIFHYEQLREWNYINCKTLLNSLNKYNINISQFVAHFLMNMFESESSLLNNNGFDELKFIATVLNFFSFTGTITIPLPPFKGDKESKTVQTHYNTKLKSLEKIALQYNLSIALEPQPNSLAADLRYLHNFENLGLNLDPGHLICSGIDPFNLDEKILSRVKATHLCENNGVENLSKAPGTYNNDWSALIKNLLNSGYKGSFDIEIICNKNEVEEQYKTANIFLKQYCIQNNTYTKGDR